MNIKYQQMKSKGNQTSELENSPKYWKYDQTIASTRNEPPPGRPSGAAELSLSGFGAEPHQFIFLQSQFVTHSESRRTKNNFVFAGFMFYCNVILRHEG
jgi:hypothetical protein